MSVEEEIARVIDKALDDWQGEGSEVAFVTARLSPLLNRVRAEAAAQALRGFAEWLDGGTPRAWDFHHPCDPPGVKWEPNSEDKTAMRIADSAREVAATIEQNSEGNET